MKSRYVGVGIACVVLAIVGLVACSQTRDDAAIISDVQARINTDAAVVNKTITVQSSGGTVVLTGNVGNDAERAAAENDAKQVSGVKGVVNNLQVASAAPGGAMPAGGQAQTTASSAPKGKQPATTTEVPKKPLPELVPVTIPEGTSLAIRLIDPIDTAKNKEGDTFRASLDAPIVVDEKTVVPKNSDVEVRLVSAQSAGHFKGSSGIVLVASRIGVGGKMYEVQTDAYSKQGASRGKRTAVVVGGGAAAGALIGGLVGGGKGAAIGAASGAGAGTGVQALTKGQQIQLPSETLLNFQLKAPLSVTPAPESAKRQKVG